MLIKYFYFSFFFLITGCASQPNNSYYGPGIFVGVWHGLVALPSVVVGLFTDIRIYNFPNSGYWYDVGFVIGFLASLFFLVLWISENS
jgi:hypothetical protein